MELHVRYHIYQVQFVFKLTDVICASISTPGVLALTADFRDPCHFINFCFADASIFALIDTESAEIWKVLIGEISSNSGSTHVYLEVTLIMEL